MDREEIAERIETRPNERPDEDVTLSEIHDVYLGETHGMGVLTVEYKPDEFRLGEEGLASLARSGFFEDSGEPVAIVVDLYWAFVDLLFPNSSYLDAPWERLPLVVELESGVDSETSEWYCSLGTYR